VIQVNPNVKPPTDEVGKVGWHGCKPKGELHELVDHHNEGGFRRKRSMPRPKHPAANQLYDNR
jgi:hypothetical protein